MAKSENKAALYAATLSIVISIVLSATMGSFWSQLQVDRKESFISNSRQGYELSKFQFCVNHQISPCDDAVLQTWSETHPDNAFVTKTYQQVVENGISEYEASVR